MRSGFDHFVVRAKLSLDRAGGVRRDKQASRQRRQAGRVRACNVALERQHNGVKVLSDEGIKKRRSPCHPSIEKIPLC